MQTTKAEKIVLPARIIFAFAATALTFPLLETNSYLFSKLATKRAASPTFYKHGLG